MCVCAFIAVKKETKQKKAKQNIDVYVFMFANINLLSLNYTHTQIVFVCLHLSVITMPSDDNLDSRNILCATFSFDYHLVIKQTVLQQQIHTIYILSFATWLYKMLYCCLVLLVVLFKYLPISNTPKRQEEAIKPSSHHSFSLGHIYCRVLFQIIVCVCSWPFLFCRARICLLCSLRFIHSI